MMKVVLEAVPVLLFLLASFSLLLVLVMLPIAMFTPVEFAKPLWKVISVLTIIAFGGVVASLLLGFSPGAHVVERPLLKIGFQRQRQSNADKRIPAAMGLMVADDELKRVLLTERVLDAIDFLPTLEQCQPPTPEASENRAVGSDKNWLGHALVFQLSGVVKLIYYTRPAEFIQHAMQPQLFRAANHRTALPPFS
jgi:hypothetical protein